MTQSQSSTMEHYQVLVIGSGAAGLNAALQLSYRGIEDIVVITEGLNQGTSINTGSDKQTYYKLSICTDSSDSPYEMAQSYYSGGSMHGDLALVESVLSIQAFMHLVQLGVPFPTDSFGQFVGYKTDHDPRQRATSIGPYTSRKMCECLIQAIQERDIEVREGCEAISLLVEDSEEDRKRCYGAVILDEKDEYGILLADDVIFAVGGPGGLYRDSVYPKVQNGAIGLALLAGAKARNLPESQFGLASTKFRWNVSGTFMQVLPRVISTAEDGRSDVQEFLLGGFSHSADCYSKLFLKGYQWPFDSRKVPDGSSLIDLLVFHEQFNRGRRVFLDYRENPAELNFEELSAEAYEYLKNSEALFGTPIERLHKMNPEAIELYQEKDIDLWREPLEIAVCAQHNNGGLAANKWWESESISHLFPIGEVNGSHGVNRPGGSALNAGQVGGFRAAEKIAYNLRHCPTMPNQTWQVREHQAQQTLMALQDWAALRENSTLESEVVMDEIQARMSEAGGFIRENQQVQQAEMGARKLVTQINSQGIRISGKHSLQTLFRLRQLCFSHWTYLSAIQFNLESGVGSRGSGLVCGPDGEKIHSMLPVEWRKKTEVVDYQNFVLETIVSGKEIVHKWAARREVPKPQSWFETTWADFQSGKIYDQDDL